MQGQETAHTACTHTRALTLLTFLPSNSCVPSGLTTGYVCICVLFCMCVRGFVWRNISPRYAQILHSWASRYSRLQYVTTLLWALPSCPAHAPVHSHLLSTHACWHKPTPMMSVNSLLFLPLTLSLPPSVSPSQPPYHAYKFVYTYSC